MAKRPDTATRTTRLLALLPLLKQGESVPIAELAHAVGCTVEQTAADLATLTMCGVPPFTPYDMIDLAIDGDTVTVYSDAPGIDQPLRLTLAEARALGAALEAAGYEPDSQLRQKIHAVVTSDTSVDELEHTVRSGAAPGGLAETYAMLAEAADEHRKVHIHYFTGSSGNVSERTVHPWALVNRLGVWYLVALCESAGEERVFRLDRIFSATPTGECFQPPTLVPTDVTPDACDLPLATVRFAPGAPLPGADQWPGSSTEPQPDGSVIVSVPFQSATWLARRVTARLGQAEVLSPPDVRDAVRHLATGLLGEIL